MKIEEMKSYEWVVPWSGGKDSTATIIEGIKAGLNIKSIKYVRMMYDEKTPATLPIMTDFVDKTAEKFKSYGIEVEIIKSIATAKEIAEKTYKNSKFIERNGCKYGVTAFTRGHCKFQGIKEKSCKIEKGENQLIGYTVDEKERLNRLKQGKESILKELKITGTQALQICEKENLLAPIYKIDGINRDGCYFCPNANKKEREYIKKEHPELIKNIDELIEMSTYPLDSVKNRNNWIRDYNERNKEQIQMSLW